MAKAELGTKRLCPNCGTRYYDLNKTPILCPRCGTVFEASATTSRARPQAAAPVDDDETDEVEETEAEFVSLEEADEEAAGGAEAAETDDDGIEIADDDEEEDTFLPDEEDEEGEDVADIIGDVDEEEG